MLSPVVEVNLSTFEKFPSTFNICRPYRPAEEKRQEATASNPRRPPRPNRETNRLASRRAIGAPFFGRSDTNISRPSAAALLRDSLTRDRERFPRRRSIFLIFPTTSFAAQPTNHHFWSHRKGHSFLVLFFTLHHLHFCAAAAKSGQPSLARSLSVD